MEKRLTAFIDSINMVEFSGPKDPVITGLAYDSRRSKKGALFFALPGLHVDGNLFIDDAIQQGARAVVYQGGINHKKQDISYIKVEDSRSAMSALSAAFYDHPSKSIFSIGVTGTDGKSSTVYFLHQLLQSCGKKTGFLSTVQFNTGTDAGHNYLRQSTPEAPEIHALLADMRDNSLEFALVEATSHGLSAKTGRLGDVDFAAAVFTNLSHEHIEFHGSFEQYRNDKANLFRKAPAAVINADDPHSGYFIDTASQAAAKIYTYSLRPGADTDFNVSSIKENDESIIFTFTYRRKAYTAELPFIGLFSIENYAAAFVTAQVITSCPPETLAAAAKQLKPVRGRMNLINKGQPFRIIVDYAHTPGSFLKVLPLIRRSTAGNLITVFGSAGERDIEKRPIQGEIADRYCDIIIVSDEDPRGEEPMEILTAIAGGCPNRREGENIYCIPDRREAIQKAYALARPGDTVLLLGKGHEKSIVYKDGPIEWDEITIAEELIENYL